MFVSFCFPGTGFLAVPPGLAILSCIFPRFWQLPFMFRLVILVTMMLLPIKSGLLRCLSPCRVACFAVDCAVFLGSAVASVFSILKFDCSSFCFFRFGIFLHLLRRFFQFPCYRFSFVVVALSPVSGT